MGGSAVQLRAAAVMLISGGERAIQLLLCSLVSVQPPGRRLACSPVAEHKECWRQLLHTML